MFSKNNLGRSWRKTQVIGKNTKNPLLLISCINQIALALCKTIPRRASIFLRLTPCGISPQGYGKEKGEVIKKWTGCYRQPIFYFGNSKTHHKLHFCQQFFFLCLKFRLGYDTLLA